MIATPPRDQNQMPRFDASVIAGAHLLAKQLRAQLNNQRRLGPIARPITGARPPEPLDVIELQVGEPWQEFGIVTDRPLSKRALFGVRLALKTYRFRIGNYWTKDGQTYIDFLDTTGEQKP